MNPVTEITEIPAAQIVAGNNARKRFDPVKLQELADSIAAVGLAQPITVRPLGSQDLYQIIAGERRFRATSQILNWEAIPCIVRELDDDQAMAIMMIENVQREDITPLEESDAFHELIDAMNWTEKRIAETIGVDIRYVRARLALRDLIDYARQAVANGTLPIGHAEMMAPLDSTRQLMAFTLWSKSKRLTRAMFKEYVNQLLEEQNQDSLFDLTKFWIQQVNDAEDKRQGIDYDLPVCDYLPEVRMDKKDNTSKVIRNYIADLQEAGYHHEAATIGKLMTALLKSRKIKS